LAPRRLGQWTSILLTLLLTPAVATVGRDSVFFQTCTSTHESLTLSHGIPSGVTLTSLGYTQSFGVPDAPQAVPVQRGVSPVNNASEKQKRSANTALVQSEEGQSGGELSTSHSLPPDAPSHSTLSSSDKLDPFRRTSATDLFLGVTFDAGQAQLTNDWPGYGQGMEGFGKRWGALMVDREARSFLGSFLLPTLLHQDPRYFRMGADQPLLHRIGYALSRVVVARKDDGSNTFNSSLLLSTLLVKSLTNAYYPQRERGFSPTMNRFGGSLLGSAQSSLLQEFLPDIVGILREHAPKNLKRLEEKLPFREHWILAPIMN